MPNLLSIFSGPFAPRFSSTLTHALRLRHILAGAVLLGLPLGTQEAIAQMSSPDTIPPDLLSTITAIDEAANAQDLDAVMEFYSPDFYHQDGLDINDFEKALKQLWEQYPDLRYDTEVLGWEETDTGFLVETQTTVTGTPTVADRPFTFTATITSEQRFENQKIVEQQVLDEANTLTAGENPPHVVVNLPNDVLIGHSFYFDAIVTDPLGDRRLLGAAIDEPTNLEGYFSDPVVNFELLSAGGLFKVGDAPTVPGSRWISGVLVHEGGITVTTHRLSVTSPGLIDPSNL